MPKKLIRLNKVYGDDGRIPIGRTDFKKKYVETGRVHLIPLGVRAMAVDEEELDRVIEEDIAAASAKLETRPKPSRDAIGRIRRRRRRRDHDGEHDQSDDVR